MQMQLVPNNYATALSMQLTGEQIQLDASRMHYRCKHTTGAPQTAHIAVKRTTQRDRSLQCSQSHLQSLHCISWAHAAWRQSSTSTPAACITIMTLLTPGHWAIDTIRLLACACDLATQKIYVTAAVHTSMLLHNARLCHKLHSVPSIVHTLCDYPQ